VFEAGGVAAVEPVAAGGGVLVGAVDGFGDELVGEDAAGGAGGFGGVVADLEGGAVGAVDEARGLPGTLGLLPSPT